VSDDSFYTLGHMLIFWFMTLLESCPFWELKWMVGHFIGMDHFSQNVTKSKIVFFSKLTYAC